MRGNFWSIVNNLRTFSFFLPGLVFSIILPGFAEVTHVGFGNQHTLRMAVRSNEDDLYVTKASAVIDYRILDLDKIVKILPFFAYQSNFNTNTWWRKEFGAEVGINFYKDIFYYGASFQHVWQKEENYPIELLDETTECLSRLVITPPLKWGMFKDRVTLRVFDEYTYDFNRGQMTFNDVGVIFDWKVSDWLRLPLAWRHTDRIHDFDWDALELSVLFSF